VAQGKKFHLCADERGETDRDGKQVNCDQVGDARGVGKKVRGERGITKLNFRHKKKDRRGEEQN